MRVKAKRARAREEGRKGYQLAQLYCSRRGCRNMHWWALWHALPIGWHVDPYGRPYCSVQCYLKALEGKIARTNPT